jgi:cardiolipin synthase A/B
VRRVTLVAVLVLVVACRPGPPPDLPSVPPPPGVTGVRLFVEPDDGVQPVLEFIGGARQTLDVAMYLLSDRDVMTALEAARRRGVRVRVMLEEHPYGTGPGNDVAAQRLRSAGVLVNWSPASFALSHDKYAVADGRASLIGTANWTHSAFTSNREFLVIDEGAADVAQLAALFAADWEHRTAAIQAASLVVSPTNSRADFVALIDAARRSLDVEQEELADDGIEAALARAAKRGVAVRVVVPRPLQGSDANAPGESRITGGGVQVRRLAEPYVHAKDLVVDQTEAFVGSENVSTPSLDQNREVGLLMSDAQAIQRLEEVFDRDWRAADGA